MNFQSKNDHFFDYKFLLNNLNGIDINSQCEDGKTFIMRSIELNQYQSIIEYIDQNPIQKVDQKKQQKIKNGINNKRRRRKTTNSLCY